MGNINEPYIKDEDTYKELEKIMYGKMRYSFMNDFLSKYSFQKDLYALAGLTAALLGVDVSEITSIEILNPIEPSEIIGTKNCILDIKLELNHERVINLELQNSFQEFWAERSITYLCRVFDHLAEGGNYIDIKPCIQIGILKGDAFSKDDPRYTGRFYSEYELREKTLGTEYSSKFQIRVLSLNHLEDANDFEKSSSNGLYYWAKLLRSDSWEDAKLIAEDNPRMKSFIGTVRQLSADERIAEACERRRRYSNEIATYEWLVKNAKEKAEEAIKNAEETVKNAEETTKNAEERIKNAEQRAEKMERENEALREEIKRLSSLLS